MAKITHLCDQCIGCLACASIAPEHFEADPATGKAKLIDGKSDGSNQVKEVEKVPELLAETCPAGAIEIS